MRVALICGDYRPTRCGVAHYVGRLSGELASLGAEPVILTSRQAAREAQARPADRPDGSVPVVGAVAAWDLAALPGLARAVRQARVDVVHVQYAPSSFGHSRSVQLAPPLIRLLGKPAVTTVHEYGGWDFLPRPLPAAFTRRVATLGETRGWWDREALLLAAGSDRVVVTNPGHRNLLASRLRTLDGSLRLLPIGPNVRASADDARGRTRGELGVGERDPLVCFFGFVHPVKGIDTLLRAFALLRLRRPTSRLLVIGGFESLALRGEEAARYRQAIEGRVAELGLGEAVALTGFRPDREVSALLQAADVCALPFNPGVTLKSGSLLAALAHGLPTVVTRGEHPAPELVDGENVLVVPPREPAALAAALEEALARPDLRARLRVGALALAARHDWREIARLHLALYEELLPPSILSPWPVARSQAAGRR